MRFVAGRGDAAEHHREDIAGMGRCSRLAGSNVEEMLMAGPPWQSLIGKNLLAVKAKSSIGNSLPCSAGAKHHREEPAAG